MNGKDALFHMVHMLKCRRISEMLIIDGNSVYEIDEECLKKKGVPEECEVYQRLLKERENRKDEKER